MGLLTFRNTVLLSLLLHSAWTSAQTKSALPEPWLTEYDECREYGDVYVVKKINKPCRAYETFLTNKQGRKLTPAYRDIGDFEEGLAEFVPMERSRSGQGLHGFIDKQGKVVIEPRYVSTDRFYNGRTWVIYRAEPHYGLSYIDKTGKEIYRIPIEHFANDYLIRDAEVKHQCNNDTKEDVLWWRNGEPLVLNFNFTPFVEQEIRRAKGIVPFNYLGKFGVIDQHFVLKVPVALDEVDVNYTYSGQGLTRVRYGDKYGYINPLTGDLLVPCVYTDTRKPTNGLFWVKKNGKWGCIDKTGALRIPHLYDEATGFTAENRSAVAINGKFGHIDKSGTVRTPLTYDFASYYNHGISMVRVDDKYGYIDTTGRFITPLIYDEAFPFDHPTTHVERSWLRFELTQAGKEEFIGFSYKLKGLFIIVGTLVFIWLNSLFYRIRDRFRWGKGRMS